MDKFLKNRGIFDTLSSGHVLELGCGKGADAVDLAGRGFIVDAIDKDPSNISFLESTIREKGIKNIHPVTDLIEDFKPAESKYSLIIANNSLPFISSKEKVVKVITDLSKSLAEGGFLYFTLFGPDDEWSKNADMSFFTQEEGLKLLDGLGLKRYFISTEEGYGKTIKGPIKFWQIHKFLYRK
ncbi:class I SAM-dependent methyltransferase [Candidatus Parcubacteria bacterium]|nr:class I SAM-dependent methyltransferase [Candidatus Parcubacteria bacterium]